MNSASRMPIAGGKYRQRLPVEAAQILIEDGHHLLAAGNGQRTSRQEIVLHVRDDQCIVGRQGKEIHHVIDARAHAPWMSC
jgi:hypothetical protein